jgi:hypothetical protein
LKGYLQNKPGEAGVRDEDIAAAAEDEHVESLIARINKRINDIVFGRCPDKCPGHSADPQSREWRQRDITPNI